VVLHLLANVQQTTIQPIIEATVAKGALIHTDEYGIYARLPAWGYQHKTVCHGRGEYARDEDGDGFCEVHVNTMEGFWSLLRSWLRPHRSISQDKLPLYLGFFQVVHGRSQRAPAWESPAQRPYRRPGCVRQPHHPGSRQEPSRFVGLIGETGAGRTTTSRNYQRRLLLMPHEVMHAG
jgi:transposase